MTQQPFRIEPEGPVHAYKTYEILSPVDTHTRRASCAEVDCKPHQLGWITTVDESTELGQKQAFYIRRHSGRSFKELPGAAAGTVIFEFPPGEECFVEHRVPLEREPFYVVRGGDWRGNPTRERRQHDRPEHWVEDFADHQDKIATRRQRG